MTPAEHIAEIRKRCEAAHKYALLGDLFDGDLIIDDIPWLLSHLEAVTKESERYKADYEGACQTVALMHEAAAGEVRGPNRGVVEDIADLRKERDQARAEAERLWKICEQAASAHERMRDLSGPVYRIKLALDNQLPWKSGEKS